MKLIVSVFIYALVSATGDIDEKFRQYNIVPQVISEAPHDLLEIIYPSDAKVSLGDELTPTAVKDEPKVTWTAEPDTKYTLIMSDPDAANNQGFLHWLVVDINGSNVHSGRSIAEYIGSGPPQGTGLHRYIFTVFKQPGVVNFIEPYSPNDSAAGRLVFNEQRFAQKYNLGKPLAGNFYRAQYDDYVPILHSRFMKATTPTSHIIPVKSVPEYIASSTDHQTSETKSIRTQISDSPTIGPQTSDSPTTESRTSNSPTIGSQTSDSPTIGSQTSDSPTIGSQTSDSPTTESQTGDSSTAGSQSFDVDIPSHHDIKAAYISDDMVVHSKVLHEADLNTATTVADSNPLPSTDGPVYVHPLLDQSALTSTSDAPVTTENAALVNGGTTDDQEVTTETLVPHHGVIIGAYKLNDSVLHTKVLNEQEIQQQKTDSFDSTEPTVPQDGMVRAAFVSDDSVVHSQALSEDQLEAKQETDSLRTEASNVDTSKVEPNDDVAKFEAIPDESSTSGNHPTDGTLSTTLSVSGSSMPVELSKNVDSPQSTESSKENSTDTVPSSEQINISREAHSTVVPSTDSTSDASSSTASDSSTSSDPSDMVTSTPPTYEVKTTISVYNGDDSKDEVAPKEDPASYAAQVAEVLWD